MGNNNFYGVINAVLNPLFNLHSKKKRSKLLLFGVSRLGILIVLGLNLEVCLWVCADWAEFWCLLAYHNVAAV